MADIPTPQTRLEAVNDMLSIIGEAPINTLDSASVTSDVALAKNLLNQESYNVQVSGWDFNTELGVELSPDASGEIVIPTNYVEVVIDRDYYSDHQLVQRGRRLYDRLNHTYQFDQSFKANVVVLLDFNDMPEAAKRYVTVRAGRIFQDRVLGDEGLHKYTQNDEMWALSRLREAESSTGQHNMLKDFNTYKLYYRR